MRNRVLLIVAALALLAPIPFVLGSRRVRLAWHVEMLVRNREHDCDRLYSAFPLDQDPARRSCGDRRCAGASRAFLRDVAHDDPALLARYLDDTRGTCVDPPVFQGSGPSRFLRPFQPPETCVREEVAAALMHVHSRWSLTSSWEVSDPSPHRHPEKWATFVARGRASAEGAGPLPDSNQRTHAKLEDVRNRFVLVLVALLVLAPVPLVVTSTRARLAWHVEKLVRDRAHLCGDHEIESCGDRTCTDASRRFLDHVARTEPALLLPYLEDTRSTDPQPFIVLNGPSCYDHPPTVREEVAAALLDAERLR